MNSSQDADPGMNHLPDSSHIPGPPDLICGDHLWCHGAQEHNHSFRLGAVIQDIHTWPQVMLGNPFTAGSQFTPLINNTDCQRRETQFRDTVADKAHQVSQHGGLPCTGRRYNQGMVGASGADIQYIGKQGTG